MAFNLNKLVQPECGAPNPLVAAAQQIAMKPSAMSSKTRLRHPYESSQQLNFSKEFAQTQGPQLLGNQNRTSIPTTSSMIGSHQHQQHLTRQQIAASSSSSSMGVIYQTMPAMMNLIPNDLGSHKSQFNQSNFRDATNKTFGQMAADQLEIKYRNDMISQTTSTNDLQHMEKLDDVQFWQSLSQKYIGPNTYDNIARFKAEQDRDQSTIRASVEEQEEIAEKLSDLATDDKQQDYDEGLWTSSEALPKLDDLEYVFDERNPLKEQFEDPFAEGLKRLEQGDIPSAALLFEAAVQKHPEDALAWRYLGTTQAQNEKDSLAIRALKNCLNIDKNDQEARLAISVSLVNETKHHEACKYLVEWLMNHDKYHNTGVSIEEFHLLDNELIDDPFYVNSIAEKHYNYVRDKFVTAARMSPNNPDPQVQNSLGVLFNMRSEYDKAVDCFKAALSVKSNDSILWNRLGATLANGGKSDEAVIAYRRALEISPGLLRSRYNLAISLIHLNSYDEAAKQLVQILNMQAAGKGSKNVQIRTRSITSTSIWNTLRTVATLLNRPELYPIIDGRDLTQCNKSILKDT